MTAAGRPLAVTDVDVGAADEADAERLRALLAEHGVVALAGQGHVGDGAFAAFLRLLGTLVFTTGETPVEGAPQLNVVTNVGRSRPPRSVFHTDTSYLRRPPAYTALRAVAVPGRGGATLFTDQRRALERLPVALRAEIEGRTARHVATGVTLGAGDESAADHPLVLTHPRSARPALYLSTPERCRSVSGLADDRATALIEDLYRRSTDPAGVVAHTWAPGDVVLWDNRCVLHRADHHGVVGDRVLHRGTVIDTGAPGHVGLHDDAAGEPGSGR